MNSYFAKNFSTFNCHVTPAVRENVSHAGRPKGGLCQFVLKESKFKKEPIPCLNWRIQAQILHLNDYKLLWINVYMPTDPQTMELNENELISTLNEIERIVSISSFHDVLLGGDWNFDKSRTSRFCRIISDFLSRNNLLSVWDKFQCDFTYQHTNLTSFSTIDHFFVTNNFLENCLDAAPIHLGDNRSNHSPIMVKLKLPENVFKEKIKPTIKNIPSWKNATEMDTQNYAEYVHEKLSSFPTPVSLQCKDVLCQDHENRPKGFRVITAHATHTRPRHSEQ